MDRSFDFSILEAIPDPQRGERVNIGVVIFTPEGIDARLPELRKLRALTGHTWDQVAEAFIAQLSEVHKSGKKPEGLSEVFSFGTSGVLRASPADYDDRVRSILKYLVDRPVLSRRERQERINTEISKVLKKAGVLGQKGDTINDSKVLQRYVIAADKDIVADFAYKGKKSLKIISTLDLRGSNSAHAKACEKGATLYFAREQFGDAVSPFGIYAVAPSAADDHRGEIEILNSFAEGNTFNWLDPHDRQRFQHALY